MFLSVGIALIILVSTLSLRAASASPTSSAARLAARDWRHKTCAAQGAGEPLAALYDRSPRYVTAR
ncbi:hypothetical protein BN132_1762 [Cronobacter turicensis 564]|nr:hypothetical protein BN132_1762 [Cronobacter turicensis 564]